MDLDKYSYHRNVIGNYLLFSIIINLHHCILLIQKSIILIDGYSYHPSSKGAQAAPTLMVLHTSTCITDWPNTEAAARQRRAWFLVPSDKALLV